MASIQERTLSLAIGPSLESAELMSLSNLVMFLILSCVTRGGWFDSIEVFKKSWAGTLSPGELPDRKLEIHFFGFGVNQAVAVTAIHLTTEKHTRIATRRASIG